ncbi:hypothetical protein [Demequina gelatinilytica]|uniref:hypothetical protein n=1 Tax=Demequina gelatinilytica TaxID=1638980 RepID=UPI0007857735|nr:hypothetical protein [Demequina gelatinilytica]
MKKLRLIAAALVASLALAFAAAPAQAASDPSRPSCKNLLFFTDSACVTAFDWYDDVRGYATVTSADRLARAASVIYGPYATSYQKSQLDDAIRYYGSSSAFRSCFRTIEVKFAYEVAKQKSAISWAKSALKTVKLAPLGPTKSLVTSYFTLFPSVYGATATAALKSRAKTDITVGVVQCSM